MGNPSMIEGINTALVARHAWRAHLYVAVCNGGAAPTTPESPNACEFGAWLEIIQPDRRHASVYRRVVLAHQTFHTEAAKIMLLLNEGRIAEATAALAVGNEFSDLSAELTTLLCEWKSEIEPR
jgi:hypothetical protein